MKTKPGWLIVILISSVQLALLLIAVITLFSWFLSATEETVGNQASCDNQVISGQIASAIRASEIRNIRGDSQDLERLADLIGEVEMPNQGFVCVVDVKTGKPICQSTDQCDLSEFDFSQADFDPIALADIKPSKSLFDNVNNQMDARRAVGRIQLGNHQHFVSAQFLPQLNSVLVVGQQRNESIGNIASSMAGKQKMAFAATLLVGFVCICLIVAILNRMSAKADHLNLGLEKQVSQREKELVKTQNAVIFGLAKLAESRDNDTGEHLDRIRSYVTILSTDLAEQIPEVNDEFVHHLGLASSLHDIGKVGIPDSILLKPGRLTKEEREVMELHALIGGECLEAIQSRLGDNKFMHMAKQVAYYHHERWDGQGYPHGLTADEIPLVARIVAVADVYDALTSKRPYKQPMSHLESKSIILAGSGTQFDPEIVAAFLRHEEAFESISRPQLILTDDDVRSEFHVLCERAQNSTAKSEAIG